MTEERCRGAQHQKNLAWAYSEAISKGEVWEPDQCPVETCAGQWASDAAGSSQEPAYVSTDRRGNGATYC
eukprot:9525673-Lingulodinium_polyedra.AAC.1